jgi:hypothetical protein
MVLLQERPEQAGHPVLDAPAGLGNVPYAPYVRVGERLGALVTRLVN